MTKDCHDTDLLVEIPSDLPCWEANPRLWDRFCTAYRGKVGWGPGHHAVFTEAYCAQWLDLDA